MKKLVCIVLFMFTCLNLSARDLSIYDYNLCDLSVRNYNGKISTSLNMNLGLFSKTTVEALKTVFERENFDFLNSGSSKELRNKEQGIFLSYDTVAGVVGDKLRFLINTEEKFDVRVNTSSPSYKECVFSGSNVSYFVDLLSKYHSSVDGIELVESKYCYPGHGGTRCRIDRSMKVGNTLDCDLKFGYCTFKLTLTESKKKE